MCEFPAQDLALAVLLLCADPAPTGKYIGTRPVKLRKSTWKERSLEMVRKKDRERAKLGMR